MNYFRYTLLAAFLACSPVLQAEIRDWRSNDGTKTIRAEFISRDSKTITLKNDKGRVLTFSIEMLHSDDQAFLNSKHPEAAEPVEEAHPEGNAFDTLEFGDDKETVEKKLLSSKIVGTDVDSTLFGRTGLNGIFKTRNTIGGLHCFLYFDWTADGSLNEVTLRTDSQKSIDYGDKLKANWSELVELLSKLYGTPLSAAPFPEKGDLQDGVMLGTHLWRTEQGHSVLLGTGQEHLGFSVNVRFTTKRLNPVPIDPPTGD